MITDPKCESIKAKGEGGHVTNCKCGIRSIRYDGHGNLAEDPIGLDVVMTYRGRELLGRVALAFESHGMQWLNVKFFNGEHWPLEPEASEVGVLKRDHE